MIKYIFILEDEKKFQKEIISAILSINPQVRIRLFDSLEPFSDWIKLLIEKGASAVHLAGISIEGQPEPAESKDPAQILLLVSKEEFLGSHQMELLKKTHQLFMRKGLSSAEEPTNIILTSFDHSEFDIKLVEGRLVNNVIIKPFDQLILQQHICFAMSGHHPPSMYAIQNMKMDAIVEMLKDVQLEGISEIGFVTRSQRKIDVGQLAKYYAEIFTSATVRSVLARCYDVKPHPKYKGEYQCGFVFYGVDEVQRLDISARVMGKGAPKFDYKWSNPSTTAGFHLVMIDGEDAIEDFKPDFDEEVVNGHFYSYNRIDEFLYDLDPAEKLLNQKGQKSIPGETGIIKVVLNETGDRIIKTEPELKPGQSFLGFKYDEIKSLNILNQIEDEAAKKVFKKFLTGEIVLPHEERVFSIRRGPYQYLFRVDQQEFKVLPSKEKGNELQLREITDPEKIAWWRKRSKLPQTIDAILLRDVHYEGNKELWGKVNEILKTKLKPEPKIFLNSIRKKTEKDLKEWSQFFENVFFKSKDKMFLIHQLSFYFSSLKLRRFYDVETSSIEQVIEVGNPIHVKELSEAGLVLEYSRAIDLGEFRKFILWRPDETEMPTFLAICNFSEENKSSKGVFANHFVFYGINDFYLKHLRLWLRSNYIQQKEKE